MGVKTDPVVSTAGDAGLIFQPPIHVHQDPTTLFTVTAHLIRRFPVQEETFKMSNPSQTNPEVLLAAVVNDVARDFFSLANVLQGHHAFNLQVTSVAIEDELTRFKVICTILV
jgi:hypothetical protein